MQSLGTGQLAGVIWPQLNLVFLLSRGQNSKVQAWTESSGRKTLLSNGTGLTTKVWLDLLDHYRSNTIGNWYLATKKNAVQFAKSHSFSLNSCRTKNTPYTK